jgi:hypothetical protein
MTKLTSKQKETFEALQQPTMSLIGSFYEMSPEIKSFFVNMLTVYEANPNEETAKLLSDKVMDRNESQTEKINWMKRQAFHVDSAVRHQVKSAYLDNMHAVPKGVPSSGMVLSGLGVVSRSEKDLLMDAQAVARVLANLDFPQQFNDPNKIEKVLNPAPFLDAPYASEAQRIEDLSKLYIVAQSSQSVSHQYNKEIADDITQSELSNFFRGYALKTLSTVSAKLENKNLSHQILDFAKAYGEYPDVSAVRVCQALNKDSAVQNTILSDAPVKKLIDKRITQVMGNTDSNTNYQLPSRSY